MDSEFKAVVVVPTIRESSIREFLMAWGNEFRDVTLIVVEDNPEKSFEISGGNVEHYSWRDIDDELGENAWIIPRRTDCIRSYGYLKAYQRKPDMIVTLDDDCLPLDGRVGFLRDHWSRLNHEGVTVAWTSTLEGTVPRGVPYYRKDRKLPCILNHGLWDSVPDLDAPTQLLQSRYPRDVNWIERTIPLGTYFPMCGMNIAFRPEVVPAFYFLLMGSSYEYDRFGDIWSGIILKKIADHLGYCINTGSPAVTHLRASSVWANLKKEAPGLEANETLWTVIDRVLLTGTSFTECYKETACGLNLKGAYWDQLRRAMLLWPDVVAQYGCEEWCTQPVETGALSQ